jgi:hypothetical protein
VFGSAVVVLCGVCEGRIGVGDVDVVFWVGPLFRVISNGRAFCTWHVESGVHISPF